MVLVLVLAVRLAVGRLTHARDAVLLVVAWSVRSYAHAVHSVFRVSSFRLWMRVRKIRDGPFIRLLGLTAHIVCSEKYETNRRFFWPLKLFAETQDRAAYKH